MHARAFYVGAAPGPIRPVFRRRPAPSSRADAWLAGYRSVVPCHHGWQATGQVEYIADGVFKLTLSSRSVSVYRASLPPSLPPSLLGVCRMALSVLSSGACFGKYR